MDVDLDQVWKALADRSRRKILDLLKDGPKTTGQLCEYFTFSRYAVMKHLGILEKAELVIIERNGRKRFNYLNPIPIRRIYERWMSPYSEIWAKNILELKRIAENGSK